MSQIPGITQATPGVAPVGSVSPAAPQAPSHGGGFLDSLKSAIGKANDVQLQATQAVDALLTGQTQDLHRTMVALQEADVSFQLMMQIRNKLVAAYEDIQRMQI